MKRACEADHPDPALTAGSCRLCWHALRAAGREVPWHLGPTTAPGPGPCLHLGGDAGETRTCPSCRGRVEVKLRACAVHGRCTTHRPVAGVACCATCPDRAPGP